MGLLSDPEYGSMKWVGVLRKAHTPTCIICLVAAILWFLLLGTREFNNETYFSENALLPGLVTNKFNAEPVAQQYYNEYVNELQEKYQETTEIPVPWLVGRMSQLHLEVHVHNFTLTYPVGEKQIFTGTNVYGILRAPRTASLEAIVISVPYRPLKSFQKNTSASIALMLAFAKFAKLQKYWAKDIIFLVTEHEQLGMQAWLEAYHGLNSETETFYTSLGSFWRNGDPVLDLNKLVPGFSWSNNQKRCLDPGKLTGRSGSIQAAINLEFHTQKIKYIEVKVEGLNGQLPNLDLVNLVHKLCSKFGVHHSYESSYSWVRTKNKFQQWKTSIKTMLGMVITQVTGVPNGNHGLFHRYGIEAVTLEGREENDFSGAAPRADTLAASSFYRLGIVLESIMRSLNNLLESFHQSYFFYILAGTDRFVSIGQYMPSLCLLCVALLVRALYLWVGLQQQDLLMGKTSESKENTDKIQKENVDEKQDGDKTQVSDEALNDDENQDGGEKQDGDKIQKGDVDEKSEFTKEKSENSDDKVMEEEKVSKSNDWSVINISINFVLVHLLGYYAMNTPALFALLGMKYYELRAEYSIFYGLSATCVLLIIIAPILQRLFRKGHMTHEEAALMNILVLVELSTACLAVGMFNFALGLSLAVVFTPLALMVNVVRRGDSTVSSITLQFKRLFCLFVHPMSVLMIMMMIFGKQMFPEESILAILGRGRDAVMNGIMYGVIDSLIYGNWFFNVSMTIILPIWLVFWQILWITVDD